MAAAAGKTESVSSSLFMELNNLEVEEELSTMPTLSWTEGVWMGKCEKEQQKAWRKQIFEVQRWRQVKGPAGAVMCEIRDLGTTWSQWHTLMFEGQVAVDMRVVPQDIKKIFVKQARMVFADEILRRQRKHGWSKRHAWGSLRRVQRRL